MFIYNDVYFRFVTYYNPEPLKTFNMKLKRINFIRIATTIILLAIIINMSAQEKFSSSFDAGTDFVSSYIWRGTKFGSGPAMQPYLEYSNGNFVIGSWGSFSFSDNAVGLAGDFAEADLYMSYGFDFGLSLGLTDYYYPGTSYFDYSRETGAHGFEINFGYEASGFSFSVNYMLNEAGGAETAGGDMYFELGYSFDSVSLFLGAGDGWHTPDGEFDVCNIGLSYSKEIEITEKFSLPLSSSIILNPKTEQFYIVLMLSL